MPCAFTTAQHQHYLSLALDEARKSPPKPTNYCVGAVLVQPPATSETTEPKIVATGYTLELPGNTHAEQVCFQKLGKQLGFSTEEELYIAIEKSPQMFASTFLEPLILYTTMEPCSQRLSGNLSCAERIAKLATNQGSGGLIGMVVVGVSEPAKFVSENTGRSRLERAGVKFLHVGGQEDQILEVATAGHEKVTHA